MYSRNNSICIVNSKETNNDPFDMMLDITFLSGAVLCVTLNDSDL